MWKIGTGTSGQTRLAHSDTRKLTGLWEWGGGGSAGRLSTTTPSTHWHNMALQLQRTNLPSPSVLASPGTLRSSRVGAAPAVPPAQGAAWRVQPPWVSLAEHRQRTKGCRVIRRVTRLPRWDSAVAIIQQLAGVAVSWGHAHGWLCRLKIGRMVWMVWWRLLDNWAIEPMSIHWVK